MENKVKVLIIRFSSIGDIVLTTPVIRCLKQQLEGEVEIHFLTMKKFTEILSASPYLSKIYDIDKSTNEVIQDLKHEQYDYIVDLHKNLRSSRVKRQLKGLAFSFKKLNVLKWILVNFKIDRMPDRHIVDRYLDTVKALGIENDGEGLDYFLLKGLKEEELLPTAFDKNYIAIVLGANHATKQIPQHKLEEVIKRLQQSVVLIGGKDEAINGEELRQIDGQRVFNACGKMNLSQSALLIKNAQAVITPDTGMMHIAAAFQKPIVSVWGNTVPELGMYPYLKKENQAKSRIIEVKGLSCRPCSKIGFDQCPKGHFNCMEQISAQQIVEKLS